VQRVSEQPTRTKGSAPGRGPGTIEYAAWLTGSCLLVVGDLGGASPDRVEARLLAAGTSRPLDSRFFAGATGRGRPSVLVMVVPHQDLDGGEDAAVTIDWNGQILRLTAADLRSLAGSLGQVVRRALAPLDAVTRNDLGAFLASTLALVPEPERGEMSDRLFELRQGLREQLPSLVVSPELPLGVHVDRLMAVDETSFYIVGWMHNTGARVTRLTAVSPEGSRVELLDRLFHFPRSDVAEFYSVQGGKPEDEQGLVCFLELDTPSVRREGWLLEIADEGGNAYEQSAPTSLDDASEVRAAILNDHHVDRLPDEQLMSQHVYPAVTRIQRRLGVGAVVEPVVQFGKAPETADVSIVVPIYLQIDHLEAQLAEFADDREVRETDLIYVLDSPQQAEELLFRAADLYPIYRVPFRVAVLAKNAGFAGACNAGAGLARGRLLLLFNSDILPDRPGWLSTMRNFYDSTPDIGALGPKLLYEDDSIQHAGMYLQRVPGSPLWVDGHYFKGMHRSLPAANVARKVPILSGACLMIDRALYERLGGLPSIYVQGDYEDSDLCLQLVDEGLENWYLPEAELYHLEGQSYAPGVRRPANRYNMWLHSHLHGERIEALMAQLEPSSLSDNSSDSCR
jgi:O-antigen biosynthesis protein